MANNQLQHTDILDDYDLSFGTDRDIRCRYDEATDNRLEWHDGTNLLAYLKDLGTTGLFGVTGRIECPQIGISADTDLLALASNSLTVNGAISQNSTFTSTVATQWILSHQPASGGGSIRFSPLPVTTSDAASVDFFRLSNSTVFSSFCLFLGDGTSKKSFEHRIGSAAPNTAWYAADGSTVMAQIFNLSGNATFAGTVTAASDTDSTHILGRARIHSATSDRAMFAHFDRSASNQYAISHFADGDLQVNGASSIAFQIAASTEMTLSATDLTFSDAFNLIFNATTGTKLGTATSQKIGFWNATPIIQPASANQAALSLDVDVTGADTVDKAAVNANFTSIQTLVNQLRSDLVAAGLIKGAA